MQDKQNSSRDKLVDVSKSVMTVYQTTDEEIHNLEEKTQLQSNEEIHNLEEKTQLQSVNCGAFTGRVESLLAISSLQFGLAICFFGEETMLSSAACIY